MKSFTARTWFSTKGDKKDVVSVSTYFRTEIDFSRRARKVTILYYFKRDISGDT